MRHSVVKSSDIAVCPTRNLSARHYIPEHRTEECIADSRRILAAFDAKAGEEHTANVAALLAARKEKRNKFVGVLRQQFKPKGEPNG